MVTYEERFTAELSSGIDLRRFPFDSQRLRMAIESFRDQETDMKFTTRAMTTLRNPSAVLRTGASNTSASGSTRTLRTRTLVPTRIQLRDQVTRKRGYYVWNVFLPLGFITLLAWTVFFISPTTSARARPSPSPRS